MVVTKEQQEDRRDYQKHKETHKASQKRYWETHKEEHKERCRRWDKSFKGRLSNMRMNAQRGSNLKGSSQLTVEKLQYVYERNIKRFGTLTCELCFQPIKFGQDELEHFTPVVRHKDFPNVDLNAVENLGIAHGKYSEETCNQKKLSKTLNEWFESHPEFLIK